MFISFSTCHEVLPIEGIPKNAFSTSCPEVEELYLIIYKPVSNPFIQELKTLFMVRELSKILKIFLIGCKIT